MKLMQSTLVIGGLMAGLAFGQEQTRDRDKKDNKQGAITGCLSAASSNQGHSGQNPSGQAAQPTENRTQDPNQNRGQQEFVLVEQGTGRRISLMGSDLAKHANHKIRVMGEPVSGQSDRMNVTKVEHLSDSCSASR